MGTKSITVTEEAYRRLKAHKRADESFTDVINRLTGGERDYLKGFGLLAGEVDREAYERRREEFDEAFERHRRALDERRHRSDRDETGA